MRIWEAEWGNAAKNCKLQSSQVHVWKCKTDPRKADLAALKTVLSRDETERVEKFHFAKHRAGYIRNRGLLRMLLSAYLEIPAADVKFGYTEYGKPYLLDCVAGLDIFFNVSHSGDYVLYAFAGQPFCGIDVEYIKPDMDIDPLAERYFFPVEAELVRRHRGSSRNQAFFCLWTCKEAYLKATGEGIAGLETVKIIYEREAYRICLKSGNHFQSLEDWCLMPFRVDVDYIASLALRGTSGNIKFIDFSENDFSSFWKL